MRSSHIRLSSHAWPVVTALDSAGWKSIPVDFRTSLPGFQSVPCTSCVTVGELLSLSEPLSPIGKTGIITKTTTSYSCGNEPEALGMVARHVMQSAAVKLWSYSAEYVGS